MDPKEIQTVEEYLSSVTPDVRVQLEQLRTCIQSEVPEAAEKISWGMPTFYLHGNLVHFFAYKNHIGFYPGASGVAAFEEQLAGYQTSKGAIRLPLSRPLPLELIRSIVRFRAQENLREAEMKKKKGSGSKQKE